MVTQWANQWWEPGQHTQMMLRQLAPHWWRWGFIKIIEAFSTFTQDSFVSFTFPPTQPYFMPYSVQLQPILPSLTILLNVCLLVPRTYKLSMHHTGWILKKCIVISSFNILSTCPDQLKQHSVNLFSLNHELLLCTLS